MVTVQQYYSLILGGYNEHYHRDHNANPSIGVLRVLWLNVVTPARALKNMVQLNHRLNTL